MKQFFYDDIEGAHAKPNDFGESYNVGTDPSVETPKSPEATTDWEAMIKQFYDEMMKPLDFNDPYVKNIVGGAGSQAQAAADARGIGGGLGIQNSQQAYTAAAANLQQQRHAIGLQALGQGAQTGTQNAENRYAAAMNAYNDKKASGMGTGSAIGSFLGGGLGVALTAATGGAAAPFIPGLIGAGAGLGGQIGMNNSGAGSPPQYGGRGYGGGGGLPSYGY